VPVEFAYATPAGPVRVRADAYVLRPRAGELRVVRPRIIDPLGELVVAAERLEVDGLYLRPEERTLRVRAHDVFARLVRLPEGDFEIERYLPERVEPELPMPYEVWLDGVRVSLVDHLGAGVWQQDVTLPDLRVAGVGESWRAAGVATFDGLGTVALTVQREGQIGYAITADAGAGFEAMPLLRRAALTPGADALRELQATSLRIAGPLALHLPDEGPLSFEADTRVAATALRFREFAFDAIDFVGRINDEGAIGGGAFVYGASRGRLDGTIAWRDEIEFGGGVVASTPSLQALPPWLRAQVPANVSFRDARYVGWVAYHAARGVEAQGEAEARFLQVDQFAIAQPRGDVRLTPRYAAVRVRQAALDGFPVQGAFTVQLGTGALVGSVRGSNVDLLQVGRRLNLPGVRGRADAYVALAGTLAQPVISLTARGDAVYAPPGTPAVRGAFTLAGSYRDGSFEVTRAVVDTAQGALVTRGTVPERGPMSLFIEARGIQAALLAPEVRGFANASLRVAGTRERPVATGRVEAFDVEVAGQSLPIVTANLRADGDRLLLQNLFAVRGTAIARGEVAYGFQRQDLSGLLAVTGLDAGELLGPQFVGVVDAPQVTLGGTVRQPVVTAQVAGQDLFVEGVRVQGLQAVVDATGTAATLRSAQLMALGGTVDATGTYAFETGEGTVTAVARGLDLQALPLEIREQVGLTGQVDATAVVTLRGGEVVAGTVEGQMAEVAVNDTVLGSGPFALAIAPNAVTGNLQIGHLDRYVELTGVRVDRTTQALAGEAVLFNFPAPELLQIAERYLPALNFEAQQHLRTLGGNVFVAADLGGTVDEPVVEVPNLEVRNVEFAQREYGDLVANLVFDGTRLELRSFVLDGPQGMATLSGVYDPAGDIDLDGQISRFQIHALEPLEPRLGGLVGTADVWFQAFGPAAQPEVRAEIAASAARADIAARLPEVPPGDIFSIVLGTHVTAARALGGSGIEATGSYRYRGFVGNVSASIPFRFPFEFPGAEPAHISLGVVERTLGDVGQFIDIFERDETAPGRPIVGTEGTVGGVLQATGPLNNLQFSGNVRMNAERIALRGVDTPFVDAAGVLNLDDNRVTLDLYGRSDRGGSATATATMPIEDLRRMAEVLGEGRPVDFLANHVEGAIRLNDLNVRQSLNGSALDAAATGAIQIAGPLRQPLVSGALFVSRLDGAVPVLAGRRDAATALPINPHFDIQAHLLAPARLRAAAANLDLVGGGQISGSLAAPFVEAAMEVERGSLRLPGGRVTIQPGGEVVLTYQVTPVGTVGRLNIDMEGTTAVTTAGFDRPVQRYSVTIGLRGDLLQEGGLVLTARAQPDELTQEQILALLGRTDLLEALVTGFGTRQTEERIREMLTAFALPAFLDPITAPLAGALGLDYLAVEYTALEQATVTFARYLGAGFYITGRRQLTAPPPGFPPVEELRVTYRPAFGPRLLQDFNVSLFTARDRPWGLAVQYSRRF
jgi:hypothetical protein